MLKRSFDLVLSLVGLFIASPLLIMLAVAIKFDSPGPVFYRGLRAGKHGRPFRILKFRTMVVDAERLGGPSTSDRDRRITSIGRLMRKYKLDELPQLLNVAIGDMSLVGPRPQVPDYVARYSQEERTVLQVRPGITDWASIWNSDEGAILAQYPDADKAYDEIIHPTKMQLQMLYVRSASFWVDVKILFHTLMKMVFASWTPAEIKGVPVPGCGLSTSAHFDTVTELPGTGVNGEQLQMLYTRYGWAGEIVRDKEVLEVACGSGIGLGHLAAHAKRVVGGDCDAKLASIAQRQYAGRIEVQQMDAHALPFSDATFDVVMLFEAIYYLEHPEVFVREAHRVLKPGGQLLLCTANCERSEFNTSPFSKRYFAASELRRLLESNGFRARIYAGFPIGPTSGTDRWREACRKLAVRFRLIPKTMKWKARLKRLVFGRLHPLPQALGATLPEVQPLVEVDAPSQLTNFKVLYAIGQRDVSSTCIAA